MSPFIDLVSLRDIERISFLCLQHLLKLKNVPKWLTDGQIAQAFDHLEYSVESVNLPADPIGIPIGVAYVKFITMEQQECFRENLDEID